jgi:hypothetical protein
VSKEQRFQYGKRGEFIFGGVNYIEIISNRTSDSLFTLPWRQLLEISCLLEQILMDIEIVCEWK